ncbi:MAG TPA: cisplatin damage response ATP-dependent DNA ligase, partial [Alphaproteobacteria bacterium]|nr:cisplatin damage response ATP-dependent DNA ligase [Alphaproteobacteria bacterium]
MKRFAALLDGLILTPARNGKLRLMQDYFAHTPDPERGWALAALTGALSFHHAKSSTIRALAVERVDPALFDWSYDFVGDLAETVSLVWPARPGVNFQPALTDVVAELGAASRASVPGLIERWFDGLDPAGRYALIKLLTGNLRVGVSARLAKAALAEWSGEAIEDIEDVWPSLTPPYGPLFDWLEGRAEKPVAAMRGAFRTPMLSHPLEEGDLADMAPGDWRAEWKWDGIRVQLVAGGGVRRLYSRTGDDIGPAFPDVLESMDFDAVLDGELLVAREGGIAAFNDLQQRLNRKKVTPAMLRDYPAFVRLYDILAEGEHDLRGLGFDERRARLAAWFDRARPPRMDVSPLVPFADWGHLAALRADSAASASEGLMLKRCDSPYVAGRPKGLWYKWKRGPLTVDTVMMYAQRGHGKRSSYYSDYTFGAWRGGELVPVGKAYFGFTDEEMRQLDKWV